jgi:hypothetical protein
MTNPMNPMNATEMTEAMREASVQGIDALLDLQKEWNTATLKGLEQVKSESDRVMGLQIKAVEDTLAANVEIAEKALGWYREQVERVGKAPAAEA